MIDRRDWRNAREICHVSSTVPEGYLEMFSYERHRDDGDAFMEAFEMFRDNSNQATVRGLVQRHGDRYLVQNRPRRPLDGDELNSLDESDFEDAMHPYYTAMGGVRAMDTVRNLIITHRGCYGICSFCSIVVHRRTTMVSRSDESVLRETERIASRPGFDGGSTTSENRRRTCTASNVRMAFNGRCKDRQYLRSKPRPGLPRPLPLD